MAIERGGLIIRDDETEIDAERQDGRIGRSFKDLGSENTASLGLKKTVGQISESLSKFLNPDNNFDATCDVFQFITAKVYENREAIGKATVSASRGSVTKADGLKTARTIGGVSFNGTANINLPGVNTTGNQDTSGNAATATELATARTIGGVSFDGSGNINLPGVNTAGNQNTSGNATTATTLATTRAIGGVNFNGSAAIIPKQHKGSITAYYLTPQDFKGHSPSSSDDATVNLIPHSGGVSAVASGAGIFVCSVTLPIGMAPQKVVIYGSDVRNQVQVYMNRFVDTTNSNIDGGRGFAVGTISTLTGGSLASWSSDEWYLTITVTTDGADAIYGGIITMV